MPRDRGASTRLLDEHRLVERHEIIAVDCGGHRQQLRMGIDPQGGFRELQGAEDQVDHVLGRIVGGFRLEHLHRMPTTRRVGAAERITQRLGPEQRRRGMSGTQRRAAPGIDMGAFLRWQTAQDVPQVRLDIRQFCFGQHVFEDIETAAPIGVEDLRVHLAVRREADRTTVAQAERSTFARIEVCLHRGLFGAVVDGQGGDRLVHGLASGALRSGLVPLSAADNRDSRFPQGDPVKEGQTRALPWNPPRGMPLGTDSWRYSDDGGLLWR